MGFALISFGDGPPEMADAPGDLGRICVAAVGEFVVAADFGSAPGVTMDEQENRGARCANYACALLFMERHPFCRPGLLR